LTNTEFLDSIIKETGITYKAIARRMGCSVDRVYHIKEGKGGDPTSKEIMQLTSILNLSKEVRDKIFLSENVL
jgi:transcriptional regulator with XRE-family HTH domain